MNNEYLDQLTSAGKASYESMQALGSINARALQKLTELQFTFATVNQEFGLTQSRLIIGGTNYKDVLAAESELAKDYSDKTTDIIKQATEILTESRNEVITWFEKGFENMETPKKAPVKRTTKKPA